MLRRLAAWIESKYQAYLSKFGRIPTTSEDFDW